MLRNQNRKRTINNKLNMYFKQLIILIAAMTVSLSTFAQSKSEIDKKVNDLLAKMTLEEKIGQMNQYNGFYDITGPAPAGGDAKNKYENVKNGLCGSMLLWLSCVGINPLLSPRRIS